MVSMMIWIFQQVNNEMRKGETHAKPIRNTMNRPRFLFLSIFSVAIIGKGRINMARSINNVQTPTATVTGAPVPHLIMSLKFQTSCPCGTQSTANSPACVIAPMESKTRRA